MKRFSKLAAVLAVGCLLSGSLAATVPFAVTAEASPVWDGVSVTEPARAEDGTYLIGNGAELLWFSKAVNAGDYALNAQLTADIYMNTGNAAEWQTNPPANQTGSTPGIGNMVTRGYEGHFDGRGHVVSGMYMGESARGGLFGEIDTGALIENVHTTNSMFWSTSLYKFGGIAANNNGGTIRHCSSNVYIRYSGYVPPDDGQIHVIMTSVIGGIVGANSGLIENCFSFSSIAIPRGRSVGGIAGTNTGGTIKNCQNFGEVLCDTLVGGLVGHDQRGTVENCANSGRVSGTDQVGGLIGWAHDKISLHNCWQTGTVTGLTSVGGAVGRVEPGSTIDRTYYLDTAADCGVGQGMGYSDAAVAMSEAAMKDPAFAGSLNVWAQTRFTGGYDVWGADGVSLPWLIPQHVADLNADYVLNTVDTLLLYQYVGGTGTLLEGLADVNADGQVNMLDARLLYQFTAGVSA